MSRKPMLRPYTVGAHNLHDMAGTPTLFADLLIFTEAEPTKIRALVKGTPFKVLVCKRQWDLVVVYDTRVFRRQRLTRLRYVKYVDGIAKVTPNRGTFTVPLVHRATGNKTRVNAEHRINAAFGAFIRGEADFRKAMWTKHTHGTLGIMRRQDARGYDVVSGGDDNTPADVRAYQGFHELGHHFDRIGSTLPLSALAVLSNEDSDHARIRVTADPR